ncbi:MAG: sulfatase family protein [Planctomycetota bacterium]|jgi:N-sulfoglucosamine sulfohydrolase
MKLQWTSILLMLLILPLLFGAGPKKNIVMMVSDDQGLQVGCYGDQVIKTPNVDKLAVEGTRFDYAFCTTSSCSPSRSVILTGLYNHRNGQYGLAHSPDNFQTHRWVKSLPVLLSQAGYRTARVGKYHVKPEEVYQFDVALKANVRNGVQMSSKVEEFIRDTDRNHGRPFFVFWCTVDPHRGGKGFGNKEYPGVTRVKYDQKDIPVPAWLPDKPEVRRDLAEYYESISRVDQGVGRMIEALKETGHWDDTLILYLSDNGPPWPGGKTTVYEPGIRLPLIVRSPDQKKKAVACKAMVTWADLAPTILNFAGVSLPDKYEMHGRSFLPVLEESDPQGWDEIYASHTFHGLVKYYPMRAIRGRKYKYILNLAHQLPYTFASDLWASPTWQGVLKRNDKMYGKRTVEAYMHRPRHELYDLETDSDEVQNLAEDPQYAGVLKELQDKLRTWQEKTKDPWMVKYTYE